MPKLKTRKSVAKRVKLTKSGKLTHRRQNARHLKMAKSKMQKRRGQRTSTFYKSFTAKFKRVI